jgi:hypothetical protein
MAFSPENSAIKMDTTLEEKIHAASSQYEIGEILREAAISQNLVFRDKYSPDLLLQVEQPATPRAYAKGVMINGQKHIVEGATEQEASEKLIEVYRQALAQSPAEKENTRQRDDDTGRFVAARTDDPVVKAELDLQFRRGSISTEDYLVQSGAIEKHLEAQGVSIEALQAATAERTMAGWQKATQEFLQSSDWPGGVANMKLLGEVLVEMGAADMPNAENLRLAYQWLRDNNKLLPNQEIEAQKAIGTASTVEEVRAAAQASQGRSSSMFNR